MADCSLNGLITGSKCFDCLSASEKQALKVYLLAQALKALGGTDLTNNSTLNKTVACLTCVPQFRIDSMDVLIAQRYASNVGAGAAVNLPIAQLRSKISCAPCGRGQSMFRVSELYLECALNAFIGTGAL